MVTTPAAAAIAGPNADAASTSAESNNSERFIRFSSRGWTIPELANLRGRRQRGPSTAARNPTPLAFRFDDGSDGASPIVDCRQSTIDLLCCQLEYALDYSAPPDHERGPSRAVGVGRNQAGPQPFARNARAERARAADPVWRAASGREARRGGRGAASQRQPRAGPRSVSRARPDRTRAHREEPRRLGAHDLGRRGRRDL